MAEEEIRLEDVFDMDFLQKFQDNFARAAGFAVFSEEIGKLADSSQETVDKIQEFTSQIGESVEETVSKGEATSEIVAQQTAAIAEVAQELTRLSETAGTLVTLANNR